MELTIFKKFTDVCFFKKGPGSVDIKYKVKSAKINMAVNPGCLSRHYSSMNLSTLVQERPDNS